MKGQDNRKYAIYSRKSKFTGKGESIENQIELCRQHIKLHHENVTEEDILIFEDEGFSGGNVNRPQFQAMMKQIRANQIQAVVCYRLDRISRNVGDFAKLKDEFDYYNVEFTSIRDDFDTTSPSGRAIMMMVSVFAQVERETTAERIRDNMHELAKSGRWLGGTTPTGYKSTQIVGSVTVDGKERKACGDRFQGGRSVYLTQFANLSRPSADSSQCPLMGERKRGLPDAVRVQARPFQCKFECRL